MPDPELDDLGLGAYLRALSDEVDDGVAERPVAAVHPPRRRWIAAAAAAVLVFAAIGAITLTRDGDAAVDTSDGARTPPTTDDDDGAAIHVTPNSGLEDGDVVELGIDRPEQLAGRQIAQCAGDADERGLFGSCDLDAVVGPGGETMGDLSAANGLRVSVSRILSITRDSGDANVPEPYDCATESAGCILVVGDVDNPSLEAAASLEFVDVPLLTPTLTLSPANDLADDQPVDVVGSGFRPNGPIQLSICTDEPIETRNCEWDVAAEVVRSDATGGFSTELRVRSAVYGTDGRTDCTEVECVLVVDDPASDVRSAPIRFTVGTTAPEPTLELSPPGPYTDRQVVTIRGTGFPPGRDLAGEIGQCPAHLDTAVEERCGYDPALLGSLLVDDGGNFTIDVTLFESLSLTGTCVGPPGCLLAWVLPHGPIASSVPLIFND